MERPNPYESPPEVSDAPANLPRVSPDVYSTPRGVFSAGQRKAIAGAIPLLVVGLLSVLVLTVVMYLSLRKNTYDRDFSPPFILLQLVMQLVVIYGMVQMLRMRSYGAAMIAAIVGLSPCCSLLWFLEIPCGLIALFILRLSDVQQAFD